MKANSSVQYAHALYELSQKTSDSAILVANLVSSLRSKHALNLLPKILKEFEAYAAKRDGIIALKVESANPLTADMTAEINRIFGGKTAITATTDESLIGGVIVKTDDMIFDGSIKKQLTRLKHKLAA